MNEAAVQAGERWRRRFSEAIASQTNRILDCHTSSTVLRNLAGSLLTTYATYFHPLQVEVVLPESTSLAKA